MVNFLKASYLIASLILKYNMGSIFIQGHFRCTQVILCNPVKVKIKKRYMII